MNQTGVIMTDLLKNLVVNTISLRCYETYFWENDFFDRKWCTFVKRYQNNNNAHGHDFAQSICYR